MRTLIILIGALTMAGCTQPPTGDLEPQDFASGLTVNAPHGEPFFRLTLPEYVFSETAWPDLRDIRLFNSAGDAVSFARVRPPASRTDGRRVGLQSFRIESAKPGSLPQIQVGTRAGELELRVAPSTSRDAGAEYLLARTDGAAKDSVELARLHFTWREAARNWQQRVTVSVSRDLEYWDVVAFRRPIVDLKTDDGQRLAQTDVRLDRYIDSSWKYWRIRFDPGFAPTLTAVEGEAPPTVLPAPGIRRPLALEPQADGSVVYSLPAAQPVEKLHIMPRDVNSVLPVRIESRANDDAAWERMGRAVAYRLSTNGIEQTSDPVAVGGRMIKSIRLRSVGASWGSAPPTVEVEREPLLLVVNARGAGPFLLAWGSRAATDSSVPLNTLVPGRRPDDPIEFPDGVADTRQVLGGESRLTALAPAERAQRWQTLLVWIMLIGGAGALAWLAMRVWRESQQAPPYSN